MFSCSNSHTINANAVENIDINIHEECEGQDVKTKFNVLQFKSQLDSLLSNIEYHNFYFQLNIDTINEKSDSKILWHFGKSGLFKIINSKETSHKIDFKVDSTQNPEFEEFTIIDGPNTNVVGKPRECCEQTEYFSKFF